MRPHHRQLTAALNRLHQQLPENLTSHLPDPDDHQQHSRHLIKLVWLVAHLDEAATRPPVLRTGRQAHLLRHWLTQQLSTHIWPLLDTGGWPTHSCAADQYLAVLPDGRPPAQPTTCWQLLSHRHQWAAVRGTLIWQAHPTTAKAMLQAADGLAQPLGPAHPTDSSTLPQLLGELLDDPHVTWHPTGQLHTATWPQPQRQLTAARHALGLPHHTPPPTADAAPWLHTTHQ